MTESTLGFAITQHIKHRIQFRVDSSHLLFKLLNTLLSRRLLFSHHFRQVTFAVVWVCRLSIGLRWFITHFRTLLKNQTRNRFTDRVTLRCLQRSRQKLLLHLSKSNSGLVRKSFQNVRLNLTHFFLSLWDGESNNSEPSVFFITTRLLRKNGLKEQVTLSVSWGSFFKHYYQC